MNEIISPLLQLKVLKQVLGYAGNIKWYTTQN